MHRVVFVVQCVLFDVVEDGVLKVDWREVFVVVFFLIACSGLKLCFFKWI